MKRLLSVLILVVGCGEQAEKAAQPMAPVAVPVAIPPAQPVLPAVPVKDVAPAGEVVTPSADEVWNSYIEAVKEAVRIMTRAAESGDSETMERSGPLFDRLVEVRDRLEKPDPDLAHEMEEIRQVRSAWAGMVRPHVDGEPIKSLPKGNAKKRLTEGDVPATLHQ
jgi:hypothetical protein